MNEYSLAKVQFIISYDLATNIVILFQISNKGSQ